LETQASNDAKIMRLKLLPLVGIADTRKGFGDAQSSRLADGRETAMKIFDYEQAVAILSPLKAKFDDCAHGEGNACETLDKSLECCAKICFELTESVRKWAHDVFSGEVVFDPEAEAAWRAAMKQFYSKANRIWQMGRKAELPCYELPSQCMLESAMWHLKWLLDDWVSPKLSVGPSARVRLKFDESESAAIREQIAALPPLVSRAKNKG
jgi:hypothetical protein